MFDSFCSLQRFHRFVNYFFEIIFSNFSVLPGQMLQQLEQRAPEPRPGIARRRGLLIRNAQRRIILRDSRSRHAIFCLSSPNLLCTAKPPRRAFLHSGAVRVILNNVRGTVWYAPPGGGR